MTDCTCLAADTAAANEGNDVELACSFGNTEGLVNDQLEGFKTEILINASAVDGDCAGTGIQANTSYRFFSSAGAVKIRFKCRMG